MSRWLIRPEVVAGLMLCSALPAAGQQAAAPSPRDRNVITAEEIERLTPVEDAYHVVLRLRPEFLRTRHRGQLRPAMATERQVPQDLGGGAVSTQPSFSTSATGAGQAPNPDAPEFTNGQVSGRTAANRGGGSAGAVAGGAGAPIGSSLRSDSPGAPNGDSEPFRTEDTGIAVYVGSIMYGGTDELTRILAANVREIRYLSPTEAQFRFGPRFDAGVIMVTLK